MAVCWISFRIAKKIVGGKNYDERYEALENAIISRSKNFWKETTSFIVFETDNDFDAAARAFKSAIAPSDDIFLMRKMDKKKAVICGKNGDEDIFDMMANEDGSTYLERL